MAKNKILLFGMLSLSFGIALSISLSKISEPENIYDLLAIYDVSILDDDNTSQAPGSLDTILPLIKQGSTNLTQTEAYVSVPALRQNIIKRIYGRQLAKYPKLITRIIEQERRFKNYAAFYHGQRRDFILVYDIIKEIQDWFDKTKNKALEFEYLRYPEGQNKHLSEFISLGELMDDTDDNIKKYLLSANISLFGNTILSGESTLSYFFKNRSATPPNNLLEELFDKLNLSKSYIPALLSLIEYLQSPTGSLLQIFIPLDKVNDHVYLSTDYGHALTSRTGKEIISSNCSGQYFDDEYDNEYERQRAISKDTILNLDTYTYLSIYKSQPELLNPCLMDMIQARINLTDNFILNPRSGIKIFRYTTVPPKKLLEYKRKLREIINQVMADWYKRNHTLV